MIAAFFSLKSIFKPLKIPSSITLTESEYWLDGGTMVLCAITETGDECHIQLNQREFDTYIDPGRLYFNGRPVAVRSDDELQIVNLLKNAMVAPEINQPASPDDRVSDKAVTLGDDIKELMSLSPEENLRKIRDDMIAFVESDEYIHIAKNGIAKLK